MINKLREKRAGLIANARGILDVASADGNRDLTSDEQTKYDAIMADVDKLAGQINLVLHGLRHVRDNGSFTLISGVLAREPIATGTIASAVNGGLEAFVIAAAAELPRGLRINAISPSVVEESLDTYGDFFPGFTPVPVADVARAFVKSVEGIGTGRVYALG